MTHRSAIVSKTCLAALLALTTGAASCSRPASPVADGTPTAVTTREPTLGSTTAPAPVLDEEVLDVARELGVSAEEARRRLAWQTLAPDLGQRLEPEPAFAGVWVDVRNGGRVQVGLAPSTPAMIEQVSRIADSIGLVGGYDIVAVRHTMRSLLAANDWLGDELVRVNADAPAPLSAGIRTDLNAVELQTQTGGSLTRPQQALLAQARTRLGSQLVVSTYAPPTPRSTPRRGSMSPAAAKPRPTRPIPSPRTTAV